MLNTLMDIAEAEAGAMPLQLEDFDLTTLIREVADLYEIVAEEGGIRMTLDLPPNLPMQADRSGLQQVIGNLVDNACKYGMSEDGKCAISLTADVVGGKARIAVCDEGCGIDRKDLKKLFRPFHKSAKEAAHSKPGVGLGLALSRRLAKALGGELRVEKVEKAGACFVLELPVKR